jgi:hypothetical protein
MLAHYVPRCILHRVFEYCFIVLNAFMVFCDIIDDNDDEEGEAAELGPWCLIKTKEVFFSHFTLHFIRHSLD